jgi:hypothetical protein
MSSSSKTTPNRKELLIRASATALREVVQNNAVDIINWAVKKHTAEMLLWLHEKHQSETQEYVKAMYPDQIYDIITVELAHLDGSAPRRRTETTIAPRATQATSSSSGSNVANASGWKGAGAALTTALAEDDGGNWNAVNLPTGKEMAILGTYMNKQLVGLASELIDDKKSFIKVIQTIQGAGKLLLELQQGQPDGNDKIHFVRVTCKTNGDTVFSVTRKGSHIPVATYTINTLKVMNEEEDINATCATIWSTFYPRRVVKVATEATAN